MKNKICQLQSACKIFVLAISLMGLQYSALAITYIGDDATEGTAITAGNSTYSLATLTYCYVASAATFTNTSGTTTNILLTQVNFEAGASSGTLKPFVATYTGAQTTADMANKTKYNVLVVGDAITVSSTGVKNVQFLSGGANPVIILNPGDVLVAGALTTGAGMLKYKSAVPDTLAYYLFNGNSLPVTVPNAFTGNSSFTAFTGKMNYNVGFIPAPTGVSTVTTLSSATPNPTIYGTNVVFTANVSPAPTNGESVTFMDGVTTLGTGILSNGQAIFTSSTLSVGSHSITATYGGDGHYFNSSSGALPRLVLYPFVGTYYVGDDATEQTAVTAGNGGYGVAILTYAFAQSSTFGTYTNTSGSSQNIEVYQINYYSGNGSGNITPYVATYTGAQTGTDVANGNNFNVLAIGDSIAATANSGPHTVPFTVSGTNPIVTLNPGDVLVSGFVSGAQGVVALNTAATGLIDYIYNGNALPFPSAPGLLTANSTYSLDGTVKFNVGFVVQGSGTVTAMTLNTVGNPWPQGSNLTFTAAIIPAPTNGEVVTFLDGTNTLGTGILAGGQATLTTSALAAGQHSIKAIYAYDGNFLGCSASFVEVVTAPFAGTYYIGDDAFEGAGITIGNGGDSLPLITYDFVQNGSGNFTTYSNATASVLGIQLTQVNYFAGSTNGVVTPFVSKYVGTQTAADVANSGNYNVLVVGDAITISPSSTNTLINSQFLTSGTNPIITLNPGDVLTAGYLVSGSGAVQFKSSSSGIIDYIYSGNSLPGSTPGAFTGNSSFSLDRTIKFNIGFEIIRPKLTVSSLGGGQFQVAWPASNLGWILQIQTNSLATGLNNNWVMVPGSDTMTSVTVTSDPANEVVFMRLVSP